MNDIITVRTGSEQRKEEIELFAKDEGFDSVSDFIRTLIEERMKNTDTSNKRLRKILQKPEILELIRKEMESD